MPGHRPGRRLAMLLALLPLLAGVTLQAGDAPAPVNPGLTDPGMTDPGMTDPGLSDPGLSDPGLTDPGLSDPGMTGAGRAGHGTDGGPVIMRHSLLQHLADAPALRSAELERETIRHRRDGLDARRGWRVFGNAELASADEVIDADRRRRYERAGAGVGLRYPLLGSRSAERRGVMGVDRTLVLRDGEDGSARDQLGIMLRQAYAAYWVADQRLHLSRRWLRSVADDQRLEQRSRAGLVRQSDAGQLELARERIGVHEHEARVDRDRAHRAMENILGRSLPAFTPVWPGTTPVCTDPALLTAGLQDQDPLLRARRDEVRLLLSDQPMSTWDEVESSLVIRHGQTLDDWQDQGNVTSIGVTVEMPLGLQASRQARQREQATDLAASQMRLAQRHQGIQREAHEALAELAREDGYRELLRRQLRQATLSWRELEQRVTGSADTEILPVLQARAAWYDRARDLLLQEQRWLEARAELELATPQDTCPGSNGHMLSMAALQPDAGSGLGFYVWDSAGFAARIEADPGYPEQLVAQDFRRVLLSFDGEQIAQLRQGRDAWLQRLLAVLARSGMDAELLLGDPHWILPEYRQDLLDILPTFRGYGFHALHLDLEIDQLPDAAPRRPQLFRDWVDTLAAVGAQVDWPLAVSLHPRYLEPWPGEACPVCRLREDGGVDELVPMVYVSARQRVVQRLTPVIQANPGMRFAVAQSVEAELDPVNSYHTRGRQHTLDEMQRLRRQLETTGMQGVLLQSWREWEAMDQ